MSDKSSQSAEESLKSWNQTAQLLGYDSITSAMSEFGQQDGETLTMTPIANHPTMSELKPCPMCGDAMTVNVDHIQHQKAGNCPIGYLSFPVEKTDTWNTREPDPAITALEAENERLRTQQSWQAIETAYTANPAIYSDGQRVLLWAPPYGPTTGHYTYGRWYCHSVLNKEAQPTHWMKLPEPPQSSATQEGGNG